MVLSRLCRLYPRLLPPTAVYKSGYRSFPFSHSGDQPELHLCLLIKALVDEHQSFVFFIATSLGALAVLNSPSVSPEQAP